MEKYRMDKYEIIDAMLALQAGDKSVALTLINNYYVAHHGKGRAYTEKENPSYRALYHILQSYGYNDETGYLFDRWI